MGVNEGEGQLRPSYTNGVSRFTRLRASVVGLCRKATMLMLMCVCVCVSQLRSK